LNYASNADAKGNRGKKKLLLKDMCLRTRIREGYGLIK